MSEKKEHIRNDLHDVGSERFPNRKRAYDWLVAEGLKRSISQFYADCDTGFPTVGKDGTVSRLQMMEYAKKIDVERRGPHVDSVDLALQRQIAETRKAQADAEKAEIAVEDLKRQQDKHWILRADAWSQLAALVGTIRDSLRHHTHLNQTALVERVGGDVSRSAELYEAFDEVIAKAFNEVSADPVEALLVEDAE